MNKGKLNVIKEEMVRLNINILGINELKWTEWANIIQMAIIFTTLSKNPLVEWRSPHSPQKSPKSSIYMLSH